MSLQSRSGGGGGIQTVGYDGSQLPGRVVGTTGLAVATGLLAVVLVGAGLAVACAGAGVRVAVARTGVVVATGNALGIGLDDTVVDTRMRVGRGKGVAVSGGSVGMLDAGVGASITSTETTSAVPQKQSVRIAPIPMRIGETRRPKCLAESNGTDDDGDISFPRKWMLITDSYFQDGCVVVTRVDDLHTGDRFVDHVDPDALVGTQRGDEVGGNADASPGAQLFDECHELCVTL